MKEFKFELGVWVKDIITGFSGVIMGRTDYLTGCNQYAVDCSKLTKEGKRQEWEWFDENRLVVMSGKKKIVLQKMISKKTGLEKTGFDGNRSAICK